MIQIASASTACADDSTPSHVFAPDPAITGPVSAEQAIIATTSVVPPSLPQPAPVHTLTAATIGDRYTHCGGGPPTGFNADGFIRCPFSDLGSGLSLSVNNALAGGAIEGFAIFARGSEGVLAPVRQLQVPPRPGTGREVSVAIIGTRMDLFDGRLKLASALGRNEQWYAPVADAPLAHWRREAGDAGIVLQRLEFAPLSGPRANLWLTAEYSRVGHDFSMPQALAQASRDFYLPGERWHLSAALKLARWKFTARMTDYASFISNLRSNRLGAELPGVSLTYRERKSNVAAGVIGAHSAVTSTARNMFAEFDLAGLSPELAERSGGLSDLIPKALSVNIVGSEVRNFHTATKASSRDGWQIYAVWDTRLGESSLTIDRQTKTHVTGGRPKEVDTFYQASHTLRRGAWRLGVDFNANSQSAPGDRGFSDTFVSVGTSLAYSRTNGPIFSLRAGWDRNRSTLSDASYTSRFSSRQATLSLDLTHWLRHRFERSDVFFRLDYRYRVQRSAEEFDTPANLADYLLQSRERTGILATTGIKLGHVK